MGLNLEDLMRRRSSGNDAVEPPAPPPFDWGRDVPDEKPVPTAKAKYDTISSSLGL